MDNLRENAPEQTEDDLLFERLFSDWREQGRMAALMGVSPRTMARQIKSDDENHASDYYRGRRMAYAAGYRQDEKGEQIKAGFDAAYLAGVRDRLGDVAAKVEFPSTLAFQIIDVELNKTTASTTPLTERVAGINKLINDLTAYKAQICSRDEEGSEREGGEAGTFRPLPVAARR